MWENVSGAVAHPFIMALLSSTAGSDSQCTPHTVMHYNEKFVLLTIIHTANLHCTFVTARNSTYTVHCVPNTQDSISQ